MESQTLGKPDPAIAVFYPCNSLMHQVSSWAIKHPAYGFELSFAESASEIGRILYRTAVTIVDATEQPARAMAALAHAVTLLETDRVALYTESMHDGLELFVRVRGALLLFGPFSEAPWDDLLARMLQSAGRAGGLDFLAPPQADNGADWPTPRLRNHHLETGLTNRLREFFTKKGGNNR